MVSIVMTVFNGEKHLCKSIDSVLNQTYRNFEFIIVNDGSTDSTNAILQDYASQDNRIIVINNEHKGFPISLNLGISHAVGKIVARIDHDDIWMSNKLEIQLEILQEKPEIELLGSSIIPIDVNGDIDNRYSRLFNNGMEFNSKQIKSTILKNSLICHSSAVFKKDVFWELGGYNVGYSTSVDYDLWIRFSSKHNCFIDKEPLVFYRIWSGNVSSRKRKIQTINSLIIRINGLFVLGFSLKNVYYLLRFFVVVILKSFFYWLLIKPIKKFFSAKQ